jgi:hypothetical protein
VIAILRWQAQHLLDLYGVSWYAFRLEHGEHDTYTVAQVMNFIVDRVTVK